VNTIAPARRVGLFGGSFDPPHLAHRALADAALGALALDEVRWIPAGAPWQKLQAGQALAPAADRAAMLRLAIAGEPRFVLDDRELVRAGPSYTIDTLHELSAAAPGTTWWLLLGQDQLARLDTWHRWPEIVALAGLAVAARDGIAPVVPAALAAVPHRFALVPLPPQPHSATSVRQRTQAGADVTSLVGAPVARYIADHLLYRGAAARAEPTEP